MTSCVKTNRIPLPCICIVMLVACMTACAPLRTPPPSLPPVPIPEQPVPEPPAPVPEPPTPPTPRHTASLQLTDQGRILIERKNYDDAIRILERAIALNPHNGKNYYYMAEAWLGKAGFAQAAEFNRLAGLYIDDPHWKSRIEQQRGAIEAGE